jgi:hypothetical protein
MVELSNRSRAHVQALFRSSDVELAERALITNCADNLPLPTLAGPDDLERVRFAALRVSGGRLDRLAIAVELAQTDWRDLLVAAGFADDPQAHMQWAPRLLDSEAIDRWIAAGSLPGVTYSVNQSVFVQGTSEPQQAGAVISLEGLEPEPRYLVQLGSGNTVEVLQRHLATAE